MTSEPYRSPLDILNERGGPAFPSPYNLNYGMTLRDYFAGQALIGIMSGEFLSSLAEASIEGKSNFIKGIGEAAFAVADVMLACRETSALGPTASPPPCTCGNDG